MSSGKSEVASILVGHGYDRVKLAAPGKAMIRALLYSLGYKHEIIESMIEGDRKEEDFELAEGVVVSPRRLMQTLGTEWGRDTIHTDMWARIAAERISWLMDSGNKVVVDDLRFPNEAEMIRSMGGAIVRLSRPGTAAVNSHQSEGLLNDWPFDATITNDADLVVLRQRVVAALALEG